MREGERLWAGMREKRKRSFLFLCELICLPLAVHSLLSLEEFSPLPHAQTCETIIYI